MAPLFGYRARLAGFFGTGFLFGAGALYVHEWMVVPFFCNLIRKHPPPSSRGEPVAA